MEQIKSQTGIGRTKCCSEERSRLVAVADSGVRRFWKKEWQIWQIWRLFKDGRMAVCQVKGRSSPTSIYNNCYNSLEMVNCLIHVDRPELPLLLLVTGSTRGFCAYVCATSANRAINAQLICTIFIH